MKLRLYLDFKDLSWRFGITPTTVSSCFNITVDIFYGRLKNLITWPDREVRSKNISSCFKEAFQDKITVIIDCFEIFIQKPSNYLTQQQCWSDYKNHTIFNWNNATRHGKLHK